MSQSKADRNAEIARRAQAGQPTADIAAEFNISTARVYQIVKATTMSASRMDRAPGGVRPRLRKKASGQWECSDGIVRRVARSYQGAYQRWLTAVTVWAEPEALAPRPAAKVEKPAPMPQPEPAPFVVLVPEPYRGEVQVLPGTAARRPLSLTPAMRLAQERARAAQPAMRSLGGIREGRS